VLAVLPHPVLVFLALAFAILPALFFNTLFHSGASILTRAVLSEGLLGGKEIACAAVIGGVFHTWEVGHNAFKRW